MNRLVRLLVCVVLLAASLCSVTATAQALAPRPLTRNDFFGTSGGFDSTRASFVAKVAGAKLSTAVTFALNGNYPDTATASFNTTLLHGYNTLTFLLGMDDASSTGTIASLVVLRDHVFYKGFAVHSGMAANRIIIPFLGHTTVTFQVQTGSTKYILLDLGTLEALYFRPTPRAMVALRLNAPAVVNGGNQTLIVTTAPIGNFILAITYPNGTQVVVGPKQADAAGQFRYAWSVPSGVMGTVHVALIEGSGTITQTSFTIRS
jgi:hypothetical protein